MQCFHCGAKLEKTDIFCIRCQTPVLTEDDAALVNYQFTVQEQDDSQYSGTAKYTESFTDPKTPRYTNFDTMKGFEPKKETIKPKHANIPVKTPKEQIDPYYDEELPEKKGNNRLAVIFVTIFVCLTIVGVGFYLLIRPSSAPPPGTNPPTTPTETTNENAPDETRPADEEPLSISSILVLNNGRVQDKFQVGVGETITLQARIQPAWIEENIIWISSDPDILTVKHLTENGHEAEITGIFPGVADIILTAGDFEIDYPVYVDDLPVQVQLENAINKAGTSIWLTILWSSGPEADYETLLKRNPDSDLWTMEGISSVIDINPTFMLVNNALTIRLPTSDDVYYLFSDNTGFYGTPNDPDNDTFIWWFMTINIDPEG